VGEREEFASGDTKDTEIFAAGYFILKRAVGYVGRMERGAKLGKWARA
jgi:hypothetical protein